MKNPCWKDKRIVIFICLFVFLTPYRNTFASTDFNHLNPNEYNQKEFESNTEFIRNDSLLQSKRKLSEEQKLLTFIPEQYPQSKFILGQLFTAGEKGRKTVDLMSRELNLFSEESNNMLFETKEQWIKNGANHTGLKTVYIGIILALLLIVLLILSRSFQGRDTASGKNY